MTTGKTAAITAAAAAIATRIQAADAATPGTRINHSVCKWCYGKIPLEDLCVAGKEMGLKSIELLMPSDFPTLEKHGLTCAMVTFPTGTMKDGTKVGRHRKGLQPPRAPRHTGGRLRTAPQGRRQGGRQTSHLFLRQPRGHERRGGPGTLRRRPQAPAAARGEARRHPRDGTAQLQGEPQGLHVRPQCLGRGALQENRQRKLQAAL
jgi:hypothetical protein